MTKIDQQIENLKKQLNVKFYLGSGYPIREPHAVYTYKDNLSGEGYGYNVHFYPNGSTGSSSDESQYFSVTNESNY